LTNNFEAKKMFETERKFVNYESEEFEVCHVTHNDYYCDLHIIASTPDQKDKYLIPVHKQFMINNLTYFKNMFDSNSNWAEGKSDSSKLAHVINIEVPSPVHFVKYIEAIYNEKFYINQINCADFHYIADYFQDDVLLPKIIEFIKENISFINSLILINHSDKFENEIEEFYNKNPLTIKYWMMRN